MFHLRKTMHLRVRLLATSRPVIARGSSRAGDDDVVKKERRRPSAPLSPQKNWTSGDAFMSTNLSSNATLIATVTTMKEGGCHFGTGHVPRWKIVPTRQKMPQKMS